MTTRFRLEGFAIKSGDEADHAAVTNGTTRARDCGRDAVRRFVDDGKGVAECMSAAHVRPLPAGAVAGLVGGLVGNSAVPSVHEFGKVELCEAVHPVLGADRVIQVRGIRIDHKG